MAYVRTTIKINYDLHNYSKMAATRNNLTYSAYIEDLLLKELENKNKDFFDDFMKCVNVDKTSDEERYKKSISGAIENGKEVKDSFGTVIIPAKTKEELIEYRQKYGIKKEVF